MLTFERTFNYFRVRELVTHPKVYKSAQPFHPKREEWTPREDLLYIAAIDASGKWLGVFVLDRQTPDRWEVHLAMTPETWGKSAAICREFVQYLKAHSECRELEAYVPPANRLARKLALDSGMRERNDGKFRMTL